MLLILADHYQPLGAGGLTVTGFRFPGMPAGIRPRPVNTFGNLPGELYLVPQRGVMTLSVTLRNNGPMAVTIESVSIDRQLPLAGQPRYLEVFPSTRIGFSAVRGPVDGITLWPGQTIVVGIPVHVPDCVNKTATPYRIISSFIVRERFLVFIRTAAIPTAIPLMWLPGSAVPEPATACAS